MTTNATYKSFSNAVVNADIGLHVGLYGINVTLKGESPLPLLCVDTRIIHQQLNALTNICSIFLSYKVKTTTPFCGISVF